MSFQVARAAEPLMTHLCKRTSQKKRERERQRERECEKDKREGNKRIGQNRLFSISIQIQKQHPKDKSRI